MYIYHFWPLSMHCKKTTTIRCFLEVTYDLLVVLRKPWICTLCFDAHFSKFRDFWWFLVIFNRKMDILDHFWGPQTATCPKVTIYLPLSPRTLSKPVKNPLKTPILAILDPFWGSGERLWILDPAKWHFSIWCEMTWNGANMSKTSSQPL